MPNSLRNVWSVEKDADDKDLRLFLPVKSNLLPGGGKGLGYRIDHVGPYSQSIVCLWQDGEIDKTADQAIQERVRGLGDAGLQPAQGWLEAYLAEHGETPKYRIMEAAEDTGYSKRTIEKARERSSIVSTYQLVKNAYWRISQ